MAKTDQEGVRITYGRLNDVLTELGFVREKTEAFMVYREVDHDALIVLPNMRSDSNVGDPYLVTVRNTITYKGIASADRFQALLVSSRADGDIHSTNMQSFIGKRSRGKPRKHSAKSLGKESAALGQPAV